MNLRKKLTKVIVQMDRKTFHPAKIAPTNVGTRDVLGIEDYRKKSYIPIQINAIDFVNKIIRGGIISYPACVVRQSRKSPGHSTWAFVLYRKFGNHFEGRV